MSIQAQDFVQFAFSLAVMVCDISLYMLNSSLLVNALNQTTALLCRGPM